MSVLKELNWVDARIACSVEAAFERLAAVVQSDVEAARRHQLRPTRFQKLNERVFFVVADDHDASVPAGILFERKADRVEVLNSTPSGRRVTLLSVKPTVDDDGVCRLRVDGESLEVWQVSRRALEGLFFDHRTE